jgi:hypothetical protein
MKNTQLGDIGNIGDRMQDVIEDLYEDPNKMSEDKFEELLEDIDNMAREMAKHTPKIADKFDKSEKETLNDIKKMRKTFQFLPFRLF